MIKRGLWLALAAWLSFTVAACLHVQNAYWAAMPVWVIAQPSRGLLVERALFRILGTVVGAAVGFGLVHLPVSPYLQLVLLALWIAGNAGLTHLLRGVRSYAALLAGITAAIVLIPSLLTPAEASGIALARVDCTLIGVVVATLVMAFATPAAPLAAFHGELRAVAAEAVAYAAQLLAGPVPDDGREERRILGRISALEADARLHSAGSVEGYRRLGDVDRLVLGSLSVMAAAQAQGDRPPAPGLCQRLRAVAGYLRSAPGQTLAGDLAREVAGAGATRLDTALADILAADRGLFFPGPGRTYHPDPRGFPLAPHREWPLALQAGALAGLASLAATALVFSLGIPVLGLAALGVCIFVMVLGSLPLPQLVAPKLMLGVVIGAVAGTGYRLLVQPELGSTAALLLTILPFLLVGGLARAWPRAGSAGVDANMCFLLSSQAGMPASHDPAGVVRASLCLALSACVMASLFLLLPRKVRRQAVDAAAMIRRDLQRILAADFRQDPAVWRARSSRQILRLALHLGRARDLGRQWPRGLLASINLGQAMLDLLEAGMPEPIRVLLAGVLEQGATPGAAAQALRTLAEAEPEPIRALTRQVAETLEQAAGLLQFGLPPALG